MASVSPTPAPEEGDRLRSLLMAWLNEFGLSAPAILGVARRCEPLRYAQNAPVILQGEEGAHVYFLIEGRLQIRIHSGDSNEVVGERLPVTMLGEISYFNNSAASATVEVSPREEALLMRLSYAGLSEVIDEHPEVRDRMQRIGDLRLITQRFGLANYGLFMNLIGWRRDRFALNRALVPALDHALERELLPRLNEADRILDVGDGPGIVSELIYQHREGWLDHMFLRANDLESAISDPLTARSNNLSDTDNLNERFHAVVAFQVFNLLDPAYTTEQFMRAHDLILPGGLLMIVKLLLVHPTNDKREDPSEVAFGYMGWLVDHAWPGVVEPEHLIRISFSDADLDPAMEWNPAFSKQARSGALKIPEHITGGERLLLEHLVEQARLGVFNPDELQHHWLIGVAQQHGFAPEASGLDADLGFFFQVHRRS